MSGSAYGKQLELQDEGFLLTPSLLSKALPILEGAAQDPKLDPALREHSQRLAQEIRRYYAPYSWGDCRCFGELVYGRVSHAS